MPNKIYEAAEKFFNEVSKQFNRLELSTSLEELLNNCGDVLDKIILREERDKNCSYIGGELKISCIDEINYECAYSLYFESADETVHTLEAKTKPLEIKFLTKDFQQSLKKNGVLKFEINEPSEEVRLKYKQQLR